MILETWMGGLALSVQAGASTHREAPHTDEIFCLSLPSQGCLTTPNSPLVNSRSLTLGPSLSLSNISGVSVKSDLKKRRAPPPPTLLAAGPPVQDKTSEKVGRGQPSGPVRLPHGPVSSL